MRYLLAKEGLRRLAGFAACDVLVALDYDGTLTPIVPRREKAEMSDRTRALLAAVARRYPTAVISGRARRDVVRLVADVGLAAIAGDHGGDVAIPASRAAKARARVKGWSRDLGRALAGVPGVDVEHKPLSLAVHFRRSRNKPAARKAIAEAIGRLAGARAVGGRDVVNVLPIGSPGKGFALERLRRRARCEKTIYVGDDSTDEEAFSSAPARRLLGVRVGPSRASAARFYLRSQRDVDALLRRLLLLRPLPLPGRRHP